MVAGIQDIDTDNATDNTGDEIAATTMRPMAAWVSSVWLLQLWLFTAAGIHLRPPMAK